VIGDSAILICKLVLPEYDVSSRAPKGDTKRDTKRGPQKGDIHDKGLSRENRTSPALGRAF
jgi:hypothetical protein